jgi:hypothetical protein
VTFLHTQNTEAVDMKDPVIPGLVGATDPGRLYSVRTHDSYGFYAGRTFGGQQLLAAVDGRRLVIALFNEAGDLVEVVRPILPSADITSDSRLSTVLHYLAQNYGYEQQVVRVKRFQICPDGEHAANLLQRTLIGESGLDVAPFPTLLQEFLDGPSNYNTDDYTNYCQMLSHWITDGNFVLHWGNEYQLNPDGVVIAS